MRLIRDLLDCDFEIVDFIIKPLVKSPLLKVQVDFKDPYNMNFIKTYDITLRIITDKDLGKGKSPVRTIVIILIIVGGLLYWRNRKKKSKTK